MPNTPNSYRGLTSTQAAERLTKYGANEIIRGARVKTFQIFFRQFSSPLIIILMVAAVVSFSIGYLPDQESNSIDATLILIIVIISGVLGFIQDFQAEKTIEALQKMASPKSKVIRDGREQQIPSEEIVPDDLLLIERGDMITADGLVVDPFHLEIDESVLSGESKAIRKASQDPAFLNTFVTSGHAHLLVQNTGMSTKIGQVASKLQEIKTEKSTFQTELGTFSKKLSIVTILITVLIASIAWIKFGIYTSLLLAISLAVAAIPEGLPAVVVLALVAGAKNMFKNNALIRKLPIVESIGAVDIICTDKTGTLTKNEMTVTRLFYNSKDFYVNEMLHDQKPDSAGSMLFTCGVLCNNVSTSTDDDGTPTFYGEQTEIAIWKLGRGQVSESDLRNYFKINEIPFSSERKMMSSVFETKGGEFLVFSKGAPEILIEKCSHQYVNGEVITLSTKDKEAILHQNQTYAATALRVLGFAYKILPHQDDEIEQELIWIGLQAMIDPPRAEVPDSLQDCNQAGIRVIMITGDNPITANAIAQRIGLATKGVVEGTQLDHWEDETLLQKLEDQVNIFARTTPFHKLRILELLSIKNRVAMTGDGVNDALAIKKAEVGIAMGLKGTEVAKQASDFILLDDNFTSIRNAIKEGRTIFNNIRKFINYLLTCNLAEVGLILCITLFFNFSEPILWPVQILWINLLTDGVVALALGVDPSSEAIMNKPPRKRHEPLINKRISWLILSIGIKMIGLLLIVFLIVLPSGLDVARTTLMTGIVLFEFVRIGAIRYEEQMSWGANKWLVWGLLISLSMQLLILYSPLNSYFKLVPLGLYEWSVLFVGAIMGYYLAIGITKWVVKKTPG